MRLSWFSIILPVLAMFAFTAPATDSHATTNAVTISFPAEVIKHSLQDILPLNIDEPNKYLDGRLILTSIDKLVMGENKALLQGMIVGKDLSVLTRVGNNDLRIKVGNLMLPLTCDLTFRYDAKGKILYVTPLLRRPVSGSITDMESSVMSLLTLFNNQEYPVSLTTLKSINAKVGGHDISVDMEPIDIRVSKGQLIVKMVPRLSKTN